MFKINYRSLIPIPEMLQTVKNIQQAITIRCVELDEVIEVHQDKVTCIINYTRQY